ncbi:MAG: hypothetical protein H6667_00530 [Ardenticatenaceae bacterium]|nr:hypothetical protein [Ardenticatenaceae bacterium]MCB9444845.1 hypothetical protein [Ardenticatenaceae bacterium]
MERSTTIKSQSKPGCLVLFGLFWIAFSVVFVILGLRDEDTPFIIFGAVFILIGVGILLFGGLSYYTRFRIGKPEITISEQMLRIGDSFTVNFFHSFKSGVQVDNIRLELVFRETATYQQGTDTRTVTHNHIIAEFEESGGHFQAGHLIQRNYELQIPPDGMHTLKVRRNKLEWFVRFSMKVPRLPDFLEEFELEVVPVLAN